MRKVFFYRLAALVCALVVMTSCATNFTQDVAGFEKIQSELKSKFGDKAYYTSLLVTYDKTVGTILLVTTTADPESLAMEEWQYMKGAWAQRSDVTLTVSDGVATDFMFQLSGRFDLKNVGALVEKSIAKIEEEKKIRKAKVTVVALNTPDDDSADATNIMISLEPENGGTSFTHFYDLSGALVLEN